MDIAIIRKAQKGNDQAFSKLFSQYEQDIYRIAFAHVKNKNDALDIVQETAYKSFKSISLLREPKYFKTWLLRIAISCSLDVVRKDKKELPLIPEIVDVLPDDSSEDIPLNLTLRDIIETLADHEKNTVILRFYNDYTMQEIARTLNLPLGSVKTTLYRALLKLRNELKGDEIK